MKHSFTIPEDSKPVRVDKFLAAAHPEYSRAALSKLFDMNLIKFNGEPIKAGFKVRPGNTVEYDLGPLAEQPEVIDLPIIYEDDDVLVVNKPAGIISHARGKFWQEASVASFIRDKVGNDLQGERGGIVHRLDRATSGVMICAKNEATLKDLQKQFADRKTSKTYLALTEKPPKSDELLIDAPIQRSTKHPKRFVVDVDGKPSQTLVKVLHSTPEHSLLELRPRTGRTHQLRVHLDYIARPIIGDPLYGPKAKDYSEHGDSLRLHAYILEISVAGKPRSFTAPVPDYWGLNDDELAALNQVKVSDE